MNYLNYEGYVCLFLACLRQVRSPMLTITIRMRHKLCSGQCLVFLVIGLSKFLSFRRLPNWFIGGKKITITFWCQYNLLVHSILSTFVSRFIFNLYITIRSILAPSLQIYEINTY